jgi:Amt family ammonium transporter
MAAIIIGAVAGAICYGAMLLRIRQGLDESCDCWSVHGVGGLWGALATGIFATLAVNSYSGLLYGNVDQFISQCIAVGAAISYSFVVTLVLVKVLDMTIGMTVKKEEEYVGLDLSQHGERAFN